MIYLTDKDGNIKDDRHWHYLICSHSGIYPAGASGCLCIRMFRQLINNPKDAQWEKIYRERGK